MDMEIQVNEILKLKKSLEEILGQAHRARPDKEISKASERDNFMDPEQAKEFGLIDHIVSFPGAKGQG
jgi:ATP-dependent Clp protease protease subunit